MVWGNTYVAVANTTPFVINSVQTDKIRICGTVPILVIAGNSSDIINVAAAGTEIPAGYIDRSFYVGQGNSLAAVSLGNSTGYVNIVELGSTINTPKSYTTNSLKFDTKDNSMYIGSVMPF